MPPTASPSRWLVTDFDGTVTEVDLLDVLAQTFGDPAVYAEVEDGLHAGTITLQECITREFEPVTASLDEVVAWILDNVAIRPGLPELVAALREDGWGIRVLSSGFEEVIEPVLDHLGIGDVEVVANRVDALPGGWRVRWRDERICQACAEACKRSGLPEGEVVYVGDGISDRCAALAADRVFATRGLAEYLAGNGVPFEPFRDFHDILHALSRP